MGDQVRLRRVYDPPAPGDGVRVLVDRIWPRGLRKADAAVDEWAKDVAPSPALRRWYGHDPRRYEEFHRRYAAELAEPERRDALGRLRELARRTPVTLLTATRDLGHSQAAVLAELLDPPGAAEPAHGDPPCWLDRVCPECGRLADRAPPTTCRACGTSWE